MVTPHLNAADEQLAQKLEAGEEDAEQGGDAEMTDGGADFEPGALVADHPEEVHGQHVAKGHDEHEERAGGDADPARQNAQVGADDGEGDEQFEQEQGALGERVEDRNEPVHRIKRKGRDGRHVAGREEGRLKEEEKEESGTEVGQ